MKFFISTGYTNYYRYIYLFFLSFVPKTWKYGAFHKWSLCERCEKDQGFARTFTLPLIPFGTEKSQGVIIQTGENTRRWLLDYYCWWKLTGRPIHFIQRDKGTNTNVQSTDENIQILVNKFLDRDIMYLKKINCRRFFF